MERKPPLLSTDFPCKALLNAASREWSSVSSAIGAMIRNYKQKKDKSNYILNEELEGGAQDRGKSRTSGRSVGVGEERSCILQ